MTSIVGICNRALTLLGQKTIASLDDPSQTARLVRETYPAARDAVLQEHPWNCATARADLAPLADNPPFAFARQFQLPADCLRVLALHGTRAPWRVEGRRLLSGGDRALIVYIRRIEDPTDLTPLLIEAIAARMAADLCEPVTQKSTLTDALWALYGEKLRTARSMDAQEGTPEGFDADQWLADRLGGGVGV